MNKLSRYEILDTYTIKTFKEVLDNHKIIYATDLTKLDQYLDVYYNYFKENCKIYTLEELNKFKPNTVYKICLDLKLTNLRVKGYINNFQKIELMHIYINYIQSLSNSQISNLVKTVYPNNNLYINMDEVKSVKVCNVYTKNLTNSNLTDPYFLYNIINMNIRYIIFQNITYDIIQILYYLNVNTLNGILDHFGYPITFLNIDDKITLCIWHLYTRCSIKNFESDIFIKNYLKNLQLSQLYDLIVGTYTKNIDYASLLFMFNTYSYPPVEYKIADLNFYFDLLRKSTLEIYTLNTFYPDNVLLSAYKNISTFKYNNLYFPCINLLNIDANLLIKNFGIIIPKNITNIKEYLQKNLKHYYHILTRNTQKISLPPTGKCEVYDLQWYTDIELFYFYDLNDCTDFVDRSDLLQRIVTLSTIEVSWHYINRKACNENNHVIMNEAREHTDDNPIVSFGNLIRYKSYNIDELDASFIEFEEEGFRFKVPDATEVEADFSLKQIRELINFLNTSKVQCDDFIQKCEQGILFLGNIKNRLKQFVNMKCTEHFDKLACILFISSMYMKKWKGPGNEYTYVLSERNDKESFEHRNTKALEMLSEYFQFINSLNVSVKNKFVSFPRIKYNFKSKDIHIGFESIFNILTLAAEANFCLSHCSDVLIQTSYIIFTEILMYDLKSINSKLREYLNCENQMDFDPIHIVDTKHIDPINRLENIS